MAILSLSELKMQLQIKDANQDAVLKKIVNGVNEEVQALCGAIETDTFTEKVRFNNGWGFPDNRPITAVSSVVDAYGNTYAHEDDEHLAAGIIHLQSCASGLMTVIYTAGYSSVPANVLLYALRLAEYYYYKKAGVESESMEGFSTKYTRPDDALITPYKKAKL